MRQNSSREVFSTAATERRTDVRPLHGMSGLHHRVRFKDCYVEGGGVRVRDEDDDDVTQLKCLNLLHPSSASEKMRFFRLVSSVLVLCRQIKVHTS